MAQKYGNLFFLITLMFLFLAGILVADTEKEKKEKKKEPTKKNEILGKITQSPLTDGYMADSNNDKVTENPSTEEVKYLNGKRDGKSIVRYKNGTRVEGEYANGMKNGIWITYYPSGKEARQESYKNNMKDGIWIFYDANEKKIKQESYKAGRADGKFIEWSKTTGIKTFELDYRNGLFHGKRLMWFNDGRLASEEGFVNGKMEGHCISWHFNGTKRFECDFVEGTGKYKGWYESGKLFTEGAKRNGKNIGKIMCWYESGKKRREENYDDNGNHNGMFYHWYEDGKVTIEQVFTHGKLLSGKEYDKDGNLTFLNGQPVDKK